MIALRLCGGESHGREIAGFEMNGSISADGVTRGLSDSFIHPGCRNRMQE
jgi:hypothetical protein